MKSKKTIFFLIFLFCFYGLARGYFYLTDGFSINNITSEFAFRDNWHPPDGQEECLSYIDYIFDQPFYYLGRGAQTYAFSSSDEKYILKLIKQKHLKPNYWEKIMYKFSFFNTILENKRLRQRNRIKNILNSISISYNDLKDKTGLLYLHLNRTNHLNKFIQIVDKLGIKHHLWLDDMDFVIQKRATPALSRITSQIKNRKPDDISKALISLIELRKTISKQGIRDNDTGFLTNMGFIENEPIIIDIGQFAKDDSIRSSEEIKKDLQRKTQNLRAWLKKQAPEFLEVIDLEIEKT
ncbi:MAG: hypothetical protein Tsb0021_00740 [Chlamydiales bacterium]